MNVVSRYLLSILVFAVIPCASGDALMRSQALDASAIVQFYVDEAGVRAELEIGLNAIDAFRNLMPDAIYQRLGHADEPIAQRLQTFFERDLAILVDGVPLAAHVASIGPSKRALRDPISGVAMPVQDDAPDVIRAQLIYPFGIGPPPRKLIFTAPPRIDIGFVAYHRGVAVNDYRYLDSGYTLMLDWQDPWYSSFSAFQLKRLYSAPMSGFIYIENFEVRKEIIIRPKDLQRWVDLGLAGRSDIPVELQYGIRQKVGEFLSSRHLVTIDGEAREGTLEGVNFLARTLTSSRVIDPPELLELDSALMGAIFVYPRDGLPQKVTMDWDLWDDRVQRIPVSAVDQAGPLPGYLEPDWPQLEWNNHLTNPKTPTLRRVAAPAASWRFWLQSALPVLAALALVSMLLLWRSRSGRGSLKLPATAALIFFVACIAAMRFGDDNKPQQSRAEAIVSDLLHNIYRAFEYREEGDIYDVLSYSVSGELLTDIFLETSRSLVLANQGGARAKVKSVELAAVQVLPGAQQGQFAVEADWTVHGSVGHWGHIHQRSNRYLANLTVSVDEGRWKLRDMMVLQEERL